MLAPRLFSGLATRSVSLCLDRNPDGSSYRIRNKTGNLLYLLGMKKRELVQLIREALIEGVMDNLTTQLSRVVVNHIKRNAKTLGFELAGIPDFKGTVNDLMVTIQFQHWDGPLKAREASYNPLARKLSLQVMYNNQFQEKDLSSFIPGLKNMLRHELEHYRQDQRSGYEDTAKGVHHTLPGTEQEPGSKVPGNKVYASIESAYNYLLSPVEIEAWVMGMYKQAKTQKVPLLSIFQKMSQDLAQKLPMSGKITQEEADGLAESVLMAWTDYAEKRLPGVIPQTQVVQQGQVAAESKLPR
jgi:hypothetical protein